MATIEHERKFDVPDDVAIEDLGDVLVLDGSTVTLTATYWDTPDRRLLRWGIRCVTARRPTGRKTAGRSSSPRQRRAQRVTSTVRRSLPRARRNSLQRSCARSSVGSSATSLLEPSRRSQRSAPRPKSSVRGRGRQSR
jgi:hypothetical protein